MNFIKLICMLWACLLLFGCGGENKAQEQGSKGYSVVDDKGRTVTLKQKPQRIVSITYGTDEILAATVDLKRVVSFSKYGDDQGITFITPEEAKQVKGRCRGNGEEILAYKPDLVLVSTATDVNTMKLLEDVGIPVYVARSPKNWQEMQQKVLGVARVVGEEAKGKAIIAAMDRRLAELEQRLQGLEGDKRKVVVAFSFSGPMGKRGGLFANIMEMAHLNNGALVSKAKVNGGVVSKEHIVEIDPEIFLLSTWDYDGKHDAKAYAENLKNDPAYANVRAVKNNQFKYVPDKYRYVASHHNIDAIEAVAKAVYPERFK